MSQKRKIDVSDENYAESSAAKRKPDSSYNLNDKVLCKHDDGLYYEAKIIHVGTKSGKYGYTIHYKGWAKRYDEFISDEVAKTHFKPFTEDEAKKESDKVKEARRSASISKTKAEDNSTPSTSKKIKTVEKTSSNAKKNEKQSIPLASKKFKAVEKPSSNAKEVEEDFSMPSTSNVKDTPLKANNTSFKKSKAENIFSNFITKDLNDILRVENEYILERNVFPKLPAKLSVEDIIKQFLESKQIEVDDRFENSIQDGDNFEYDTYEPDSVMAFFLNIFNTAFPLKLAYDEERPTFDEILKNESDEKGDASQKKKRYSEVLGLSHLLRYITCLNDLFVDSIFDLNPAIANPVIDSVKELCVYLDKNISKFYNEDEYYKMDV